MNQCHRKQSGQATLYLIGGLAVALGLALWFAVSQTKSLGKEEAAHKADKATYESNLKEVKTANDNWTASYQTLAGEFVKRQKDILDRDQKVSRLRKELKDAQDNFGSTAETVECRDVVHMRVCPELFKRLREPVPGAAGSIHPSTDPSGMPGALVHDGRGGGTAEGR